MPIDDYPGDMPEPQHTTGTAKYIKISVPNFASADNPMGSYLRLGSTEDDITPGVPNATVGGIDVTGEDLASLVRGFADDLRVRTTADPAEIQALMEGRGAPSDIAEALNVPPAERLPTGTTAPNAPGPLLDPPTSISNGQYPGTVTNRLAESNVLHTKGGWRDHSDGNRITTTRGDKVEIIQGNYKMVVLGRQYDAQGNPDLDAATGWDMSGGLVDTTDLAKSSAQRHDRSNLVYGTEYAWEKESDGRWGWTQTMQLGSPDPSTNPSGMGNGKQISFTWLDEIQTYVGSPPPTAGAKGVLDVVADTQISPKPVNSIKSRTWANMLDTATFVAGDMNETYDITGTHTVTTNAGNENDQLIVSGDVTSFVSGTNVSSETSASDTVSNSTHGGSLIESTSFGTHMATNQIGANLEMDFGGISLAISIIPLLIEIKALYHFDIHGAAHFDIHGVTHNDLHLGPHLTVDSVPSIDIKAAHTVMNVLTMFL